MSDRLDMPEVSMPCQSPQQKQLKMADLEAQGTTPAPAGQESLEFSGLSHPNARAGSPKIGIIANRSNKEAMWLYAELFVGM